MGNLIKAENRKILTTNLWWGLLIPAVLIAFCWAMATGFLFDSIKKSLEEVDSETFVKFVGSAPSDWDVTVLGLARSINFATLFPMIFGGLAIANEINHKTIRTTFLTAPSRGSVMTSKMIVYVGWGAIYGTAIVLAASLGVWIVSDTAALPSFGGWLALASAGVLASVIMTVLGIGVGALLRNTALTVVLLIFYMLLLENMLGLVFTYLGWSDVINFLPNGSANGLTGSLAATLFFSTSGFIPDELFDVVQSVAGATGSLDWWQSALVFLVWAGLFFSLGWLNVRQREVD